MKNKFMIMTCLIVVSLWTGNQKCFSQTISDYSSLPVFMSTSLQPNVMVMLDTSMNMFKFAYYEGWETPKDTTDDNYGTNNGHPAEGFNPSINYYGLFDYRYFYTYGSNKFTPTVLRSSRVKASNEWDGNFLNWLTMRRIDVLRKVLTGGKESGSTAVTETPSSACAEASEGAYKRIAINADNFTPFPGETSIDFKIWKSGIEKGSSKYALSIVKVSGTATEGIIQKLYDRFRWGLTFFNTDDEGGKVSDPTKQRNLTAIRTTLVNNINTVTPSGKTPLAEALWGITGFFAQTTGSIQGFGSPGPSYHSGDYTINNEDDPYNYGTGGQPVWAPCAKTAVVLVTAGEPCGDGNLPDGLKNYATGTTYDCTSRSASGDCYFSDCGTGAVPGVEDVALFAHTRDIRDSLDGDQKLDIYVVSVFGPGTGLLKYTAINGGFTDKGEVKDGVPNDSSEFDVNPDIGAPGEPDNYFEARNGTELEEALQKTAELILKKVSSGTSVAVLSTSDTGEGSLFQAYFKPEVYESGTKVRWLGYLQGLWVDNKGNLREDTVDDQALVYTQDKIIEYVLDPDTNEPKIEKYSDSDGDGNADSTTPDGPAVGLSAATPIWEAGKMLAKRTASSRTIYTFKDADADGLVDTGEFIPFTTTNASALQPYLRASSTDEAQNIIRFIRGEWVDGYRERRLTVDGAYQVWKLGDIVYSTPTVSGKPAGNYHITYGDSSYAEYYSTYKDRDTIICTGANDGMLHAFWAGRYHSGDDDPMDSVVKNGWYEDTSSTLNPGDEIWGYIPCNLLPHLKWLTDPTYGDSTHVYYVDLKPRIADVKIFTADSKHINGWGTVLIGGMRLGGGNITGTGSLASRTFSSAYFCLDITDPANPELLWEYTNADLGYTSSYPAVAKVGTKWFAVFGSGPTNLARGDCDNTGKNGKIFIVDIADGTASQVFTATESGAFFTDPIAIDTQLDYSVDRIYIGETYDAGTTYGGKMYRLWTKNSSGVVQEDPASWVTPSVFFDTTATGKSQPLTSGATAAFDESHNLWVYFGTGKFMGTIDKSDPYQQTFYGIKDPCSVPTCTTTVANNDTSLFNSTGVTITQTGSSTTSPVTVSGAGSITTWNALLANVGQANAHPGGWYFNLWANTGTSSDPSERVIYRPVAFGGVVLFTTFIPNYDVCGFGGTSSLYALNYLTGTANSSPVIGTSGTEIRKKQDLGSGMASGVALHVVASETGGTSNDVEKAYIQMSTGVIVQADITTSLVRSGTTAWRETK
ncbi:MAG: PilC/PilY family type IV pilus protein [Thermodesulfobacteriota bacterium]|jgi:type IV pilus assembly protein PilY1|nr:MAG: PilC/PilY family type IV pilus protein [Thermodesulfobacteriota bacterium]